MIRTLRTRFVCIVMGAFLPVLILILLGVNLVNTRNVYAGIDERLTYLAESDLGPPMGLVMMTPEHIRGWLDLNSAGIISETSYFIITGDLTGPILTHQLKMLSAATGQDAEALIETLLADAKDRGDAAPYRYYVAERGEPFRIVFLRCDSEFASIRSLWRTSAAVALIAFVLVLLTVTLLSGPAIRPFAANIENQRRFISNASHELKTPLGVIMSDLDLQILESGETEWLKNAQVQADHLALLIEQLTAYSLLTERKQDAAPLPVDVSAIAEGLLSDFHPLALARGQTVASQIEPGVTVTGNEDALRTLLSVLMDNAVKYTPAGGEIRLAVRRGKKAVMELTNSCADLDSLDLDHLFERFYRSPDRRSKQDGHGLGLSIAQEIAAMYGGVIRARADREQNTLTFTVEMG